jgi:hypothetical protein
LDQGGRDEGDKLYISHTIPGVETYLSRDIFRKFTVAYKRNRLQICGGFVRGEPPGPAGGSAALFLA